MVHRAIRRTARPGRGHRTVPARRLDGQRHLVGLHQFPDTDVTTAFSERRAGLDHVAFGVQDRFELLRWGKRLDQLGIGHDEINDAGYGSGISFRDPDGLPLEFFAPPTA